MGDKKSIEEVSYFGFDEDGNFINVPPMEDCLTAIRTRYQSSVDTNERLRNEIKRLKSEHYKDDEIQRLTKELEIARANLHRGFEITEKEKETIDKWQKEHDEVKHGLDTLEKKLRVGGAIGGRYSYHFLPTSIGVVGTCKCNACGEEFIFCNI